MSSSNWFELIVAFVALSFVAISAWVEANLAAVTRVDIRRLFDNKLSREDALLIERTHRLRSAILLIEVLSAGVATAMLSALLNDLDDDYGVVYSLLIALGVLIVAGRLIPRALAREREDGAAEDTNAFRVGQILAGLFAPVVKPVEWLTDALSRGKSRRRIVIDTEEQPTQESGSNGHAGSDRERERDRDRDRQESHLIEDDEHDMISAILQLERSTARQIMVPRIDIVAVSSDVLLSEAVDVAIQAGHSRIPVYGRSMDEIIGVIYAKDLLRYVNEEHEGLTVESLLRPAFYVPESKRVDDLLSELQQSQVHLAIVVDEYGGTAGVVTIEDILEEIVGEIQDEYDREPVQFELISVDEAMVDGRISIDDLADEMDMEWPDAATGTVGGYIQRQLGRIPAENEIVEVDGLRLTVLKVEHRRIRRVRVERLHPDEAANDATMAPDSAATMTEPL